jgi:hypothetical protein
VAGGHDLGFVSRVTNALESNLAQPICWH